MSKLDMKGPFLYDSKNIESAVDSDRDGNYALGYKDKNEFIPKYVGRGNIKNELKNYLNKYKAPLFMFSYADTKQDMIEKECENYHYFKPVWNERHPALPSGMKCPYCNHSGE